MNIVQIASCLEFLVVWLIIIIIIILKTTNIVVVPIHIRFQTKKRSSNEWLTKTDLQNLDFTKLNVYYTKCQHIHRLNTQRRYMYCTKRPYSHHQYTKHNWTQGVEYTKTSSFVTSTKRHIGHNDDFQNVMVHMVSHCT